MLAFASYITYYSYVFPMCIKSEKLTHGFKVSKVFWSWAESAEIICGIIWFCWPKLKASKALLFKWGNLMIGGGGFVNIVFNSARKFAWIILPIIWHEIMVKYFFLQAAGFTDDFKIWYFF